MEKLNQYVTLSNGLKMPKFGLGTSCMTTEEEISNFVKAVVEFGYRHIDTASFYDNEEIIGKALKQIFAAGIKREELFIVTKLWNTDHDIAEEALVSSLKRMQLDFVDLYLIHWPVATKRENDADVFVKVSLEKTWRDMEKNVKKGLARSIGVSNYNFQTLNDLLSYAEIPPVCNQIELYPYLAQSNFVDWMKSFNVQPVAYSPLGSTYLIKDEALNVLKDGVIQKIAEKHSKSVGQVILSWGMARGHVVIPKSSNPARIKENIESLAIELQKEEVDAITALDKNLRIIGGIVRNEFLVNPIFE